MRVNPGEGGAIAADAKGNCHLSQKPKKQQFIDKLLLFRLFSLPPAHGLSQDIARLIRNIL